MKAFFVEAKAKACRLLKRYRDVTLIVDLIYEPNLLNLQKSTLQSIPAKFNSKKRTTVRSL